MTSATGDTLIFKLFFFVFTVVLGLLPYFRNKRDSRKSLLALSINSESQSTRWVVKNYCFQSVCVFCSEILVLVKGFGVSMELID